jgi:hypothetical protein
MDPSTYKQCKLALITLIVEQTLTILDDLGRSKYLIAIVNRSLHKQMLITSLCNQKSMPSYKSLWGTDPFYDSPDLSPHARFITPQCGRLIQGERA